MSINIIIIGVIVILTLYIWSVYNNLATGKVRIKEALSAIDVQLKRRVDLIPNLIETVKGYTKHEKEVFENVTKARESLMGAQTLKEKADSNNMLSTALKSLFAILTSVNVDAAIADRAGEYMRKFSKSHALNIGDALIAATAKEMVLNLVTRNIKHYPMKDVDIIKPY